MSRWQPYNDGSFIRITDPPRARFRRWRQGLWLRFRASRGER